MPFVWRIIWRRYSAPDLINCPDIADIRKSSWRLIRLYRLTHEQRYLDLSRFFVEQRGTKPHYFDREAIERLDSTPFRPTHPVSPYAYMQAHVPIREQREVVGHAVRAMYLYSAVADLAYELKDEELVALCKNLLAGPLQEQALYHRWPWLSRRERGIHQGLRSAKPRKLCGDLRCDRASCNGPTAWFISISTADTPTRWREHFITAFWPGSGSTVNPSFIIIRSRAMVRITG